MSTLVAFAVGGQYRPGGGVLIVGAHTDSPCLKLKPRTEKSREGYHQIAVQTYGGGLWHTWFDRDLGLAGRVLLKSPTDGSLRYRLVKLNRPLMSIPMLAIHLNRDIHTKGFKPNTESEVVPVLATEVKAKLAIPDQAQGEIKEAHPQQSAVLIQLLCDKLGVKPEEIVDFELQLCDVQPGTIGGAAREFVYCGRLDNLASSYCSLEALLDADGLEQESGIRAVALFDHEEVGSVSAIGAGGPVMMDTIQRVTTCLSAGEEGAVVRALQRSFCVSADMAHAVHPNYADRHEAGHKPAMHHGMVIKHNANQRYGTSATTAALFREVGRRRGLPCQEFVVRNDTGCGSTIGPILSANTGMRTVDVGIAQLAMHSIREMCGAQDVGTAYEHFKAFFEEFSRLDATLEVDNLPPADIKGVISDVDCCDLGKKAEATDV